MTAHVPVVIDDHGTELYVPRSTLAEVMEENARLREQSQRFHVGQPASFGSVFGRSFKSHLGTQPDDERLLREEKGWMWIASDHIANRVRSIPYWTVMDQVVEGKVETTILLDHDLTMLLRMPNRFLSGGDLKWVTTHHLNYLGKAYWQIMRGDDGMPVELWPMDPTKVDEIAGPTGPAETYEVRGNQGGRTITLLDTDVIRFARPDPAAMASTIGKLGPQALEYESSRFLEQHENSFWQNDATPRVVLESPESLGGMEVGSPEERNFHASWRNAYDRRHGRQQGVPAVLPPGVTAKELDSHGGENVDDKKYYRDLLLAAVGVHPSSLGLVENVNRANAEVAETAEARNTIKPLTVIFADAITNQLAIPVWGPQFRVAWDDFIPEDKEFNLKRDEMDSRLAIRSNQQIIGDRGGNPDDASWAEFPIQPLGVAPYTGEAETFPEFESLQDLLPGGAENGDAAAIAATSEGANVAQTALNGAQVTALIEILAQQAEGLLSKAQASALIGAAFPTFDAAQINGLVGRKEGTLRRLRTLEAALYELENAADLRAEPARFDPGKPLPVHPGVLPEDFGGGGPEGDTRTEGDTAVREPVAALRCWRTLAEDEPDERELIPEPGMFDRIWWHTAGEIGLTSGMLESAVILRGHQVQAKFVKSFSFRQLRIFNAQQRSVIEQLEEGEFILPSRGMRGGQRIDVTQKQAAEAAALLLNPRSWLIVIDEALQPVRTAAWMDVARTAFSEVATEGRYQLGKAGAKVLERQGILLGFNELETTTKRIAIQLFEGLNLGETTEQLAKRIEADTAGTFNRFRARTIAGTELLTANSAGQEDGWRQTGEVGGTTWHASFINTRPTHAALDGVSVDFGEDFSVGGNPARFPGDNRLPAEERVNCRCFKTPLLSEA